MMNVAASTIAPGARQEPLRRELGLPSEQQALEVARNFESLLLHQLVRDMRGNASAFGEGMFGSSPGSGQHEALFDDLMAKRLADSGRVGVADAIVRSLRESGRLATGTSAPQSASQQAAQAQAQSDDASSASSPELGVAYRGRRSGESLEMLPSLGRGDQLQQIPGRRLDPVRGDLIERSLSERLQQVPTKPHMPGPDAERQLEMLRPSLGRTAR